MIPTDRMQVLLRKAAVSFDDKCSPFETDWLVKNSVSFDECMTMSEQIAWAIRMYLTFAKKIKGQGHFPNLDKQIGMMIYVDVIREFYKDTETPEDLETKQKRQEVLDEMVAENQRMGFYE